MAAAALATATLWQTSPYGEVDAALVDGLERAVAWQTTPPPPSVPCSSGHADAVYYEPDPAPALARSAEAVGLARAAGDPDTLVLALSQRFRALWRTLVPSWTTSAAELVAVVEPGGVTPGLAAVAHLVAAVLALSHADRAAFEAHMAAARRRPIAPTSPGC